MGFLDTITNHFRESSERKKQERRQLERLRLEASQVQQVEFEQQYRKDSLEVARAHAKRDAAKLSGLQKLRAINRASRLTEPQPGFMSKLSEYTQKNKARQEVNMKRTDEMRAAAKKLQEERLAKSQAGRLPREDNRGLNTGRTWY